MRVRKGELELGEEATRFHVVWLDRGPDSKGKRSFMLSRLYAHAADGVEGCGKCGGYAYARKQVVPALLAEVDAFLASPPTDQRDLGLRWLRFQTRLGVSLWATLSRAPVRVRDVIVHTLGQVFRMVPEPGYVEAPITDEDVELAARAVEGGA